MVSLVIRIKRNTIRLIIAIILWIIFAYNHLVNYRYTWYYRYNTDETQLHIQMNQQLKLSQLYWNQLLTKTNYNYNYNFSSDICTVIISSSRNKHPTLHYTLSSLLSSMTHEDKLKRKILIYNTARPSYLHKYAEELSNAKIPFIEVLNSSQQYFEFYNKIPKLNSTSDEWILNETIDYLTVLSICEKRKYNNILILEDDIIFTKNFFEKLQTIIINNNNHNCSLIKLFKSDYWDGWEFKHIPILIFLSLFISLFIIFIFISIDKQIYSRSIWLNVKIYKKIILKNYFSIFILFIFWLIWFLFILIILLSVNRQNFQFLFGLKNGIHIMKSSTAGTLAQLYSSKIINQLKLFILKQLNQQFILNKPMPIDVLLNQFFQEQISSLVQCHSIPDLVDHIGVYSSNINKNQGNFISMKQSGTFQIDQASISFQFNLTM